MKRIKSIGLMSFSSEALAAYCADVERLARTYLKEGLYGEFSKAFVSMRMEWADAAESASAKIDEADAAADLAWNAIHAQLRINIAHYDAGVQAAARSVLGVFSKIEDPTRLPYDEEYAQLNRLLGLLSELPAEVRHLAMVDGWIEELQRRVGVVCSLRSESSGKECASTKVARLALIDAYDALIQKVNSMAYMAEASNDAKTIAFIDALNAIIDDHLLMQKIRQKIAENASR